MGSKAEEYNGEFHEMLARRSSSVNGQDEIDQSGNNCNLFLSLVNQLGAAEYTDFFSAEE